MNSKATQACRLVLNGLLAAAGAVKGDLEILASGSSSPIIGDKRACIRPIRCQRDNLPSQRYQTTAVDRRDERAAAATASE